MANAAETQHLQTLEYARSVQTLYRWGGSLLTRNAIEQERSNELRALSFNDYVSALREMLRTDNDFREKIDVDDKEGRRIIDGQVCASDGTPMAELIAGGRRSSAALAEKRPEFAAQVIRDAGDELVAKRADALQPGQTLFTLSMEPKEELRHYPKTYRKLGYREGLSYIQYYAKVDEDTLISAFYSVDVSDETTWRKLFADMGVEIPADANPNTFIRYGFERTATPDQADKLVRGMRKDYYVRRGVPANRRSVSEYIRQNQAMVEAFFNNYYPALARAGRSGQNNDTLKDFAQTVLSADIEKLKPEVRRELMHVASAEGFSQGSIMAVDEVIRYAVVEELRKGLEAFIDAPLGEQEAWQISSDTVSIILGAHVSYTNELLAQNIARGVKAGRGYGGCSSVELAEGENDLDATGGTSNPQSAYGGRGSGRNREKWKIKRGRCVVTTCPTRPGEVKVGPCGVCIDRCQQLYDSGKDPTKMGVVTRAASKNTTKATVDFVTPPTEKLPTRSLKTKNEIVSASPAKTRNRSMISYIL